jgi:Uma2 family endonuclease
MPTAIQSSPITVEQYEGFEGYPNLKDELINGELVLSPQPNPFHQQIAKNVNRLLDDALKGQGYTAQQNSNIRFREANSMPSPDVFVITTQDWKLACESDDYLSAPPILVVEILSPANRKKPVEAKIGLYLNNRVVEVWLVRPKLKTVEVCRKNSRWFPSVLSLHAPLSGSVDPLSFFVIGE